MSHVLPSRSPALASENKCLINGFSDHLKRLPRTHPKVVSEQNKHTAHTHVGSSLALRGRSGPHNSFQLSLWDS